MDPAQRLQPLFSENFEKLGEIGSSVSVWIDGKEVLSLAGGHTDRERLSAWTAETPVLVWSATKGLAAACFLHACQERHLSLTTPMAEIWPEFGQSKKGRITLLQVLSHQGGLPILSREAPVLEREAVVRALEEEAPHWEPGDGHGYHPRTFGFLLDEALRRITGGTSIQDYWRQHFAEPLGLKLWIGMEADRVEEVAPVFAARSAFPKDNPFYRALMESGSFTARAFASPRGLHSVSAMNTPEARTASLPAFGGIGTAGALAKFYAMLAMDGELEGRRYFERETCEWMQTTLTNGPDRVLQMDTAFSTGFMKDPTDAEGRKRRSVYGPSQRAFGHPGAGGSVAFADPEHRVSFAYVMNQMEPGVLPNAKALRLIEELYRCL